MEENRNYDTAFHLAVKDKLNWVVDLLLGNPKTSISIINRDGETPLHLALDTSNRFAVARLLDDPRFVDQLVTLRALDRALYTQLCTRLSWWSDLVTDHGYAFLHIMARRQYSDLIRTAMADRVARPNARNKAGETAWDIAVQGGSKDVIKALLSNYQVWRCKQPLAEQIRRRNANLLGKTATVITD